MEIKNHFGVYAVCFENGKLLCIEKTRGPYQHRYDLPGGSQQLGEGLTETLIREVMEETGYTVRSYSNPRIYDVFVREELKNFMVHHIMALYDVEMNEIVPKLRFRKLCLMVGMIHLVIFGWIFKRSQKKMLRP